MEFKYPGLTIEPKSGKEPFTSGGRPLNFCMGDFWRWYASDLASNALRGVVAEFIVAQALGLVSGTRLEWDACDLRSPEGKRIEVKSAAYLQTWAQKEISTIRFGIAPGQGWDALTNKMRTDYKRYADVYVFCLLYNQDQRTLDPLNLDQWEFYIVPTRRLDEKHPKQKSIGLNPLRKLQPEPVGYHGLALKIKEVLASA